MSPLLSPVSLSSCEHMFCQRCLEQLPKNECPCDRLPFDKAVSASKVVHTLCDELLVKCVHESCNETMKRGDLMVHLRNKCKAQNILKRGVYAHNVQYELEKVIEFASVACAAVPTTEEEADYQIETFEIMVELAKDVLAPGVNNIETLKTMIQEARDNLTQMYLSKEYSFADMLEDMLARMKQTLKNETLKVETAQTRIVKHNRCIEILKYLKGTTSRCLEPIIHINPRGTHVYTTRKTLCSHYPESDLAVLFSDLSKKDFLVDRDGGAFSALIDWLRDGCQETKLTQIIVDEAAFWKIHVKQKQESVGKHVKKN